MFASFLQFLFGSMKWIARNKFHFYISGFHKMVEAFY